MLQNNSLQIKGMHKCANMKTVYANTNGIVIMCMFLTIKDVYYIITKSLL